MDQDHAQDAPTPETGPPDHSPPAASDLLRSPLTFDDLAADLVWPRLLRATSLALVPQRLIMSLFLVILVSFVANLAGGAGVSSLLERVPGTGPSEWGGNAAGWLYAVFVAAPEQAVTSNWVGAVLAGVVMLVVTSVFAGAICRSAAVDAAQNVTLPWPKQIAFALGRWPTFVAVVAGPLVFVWAAGLGIALVGWILFSLPIANVLGGLLYVLTLGLSFVVAVVLLAYALVHPVLIPCVACEAADTFDALSRAYEFLFNRPLRFVLYLGILVVQGVVVIGIAILLVTLTETFATSMSLAWVGSPGPEAFAGVSQEETTWSLTAWFIQFWTGLLHALVWAFGVSYALSGSTLMYLGLRRISDGQDMSEIWVPGLLEGTMAESVGE